MEVAKENIQKNGYDNRIIIYNKKYYYNDGKIWNEKTPNEIVDIINESLDEKDKMSVLTLKSKPLKKVFKTVTKNTIKKYDESYIGFKDCIYCVDKNEIIQNDLTVEIFDKNNYKFLIESKEYLDITKYGTFYAMIYDVLNNSTNNYLIFCRSEKIMSKIISIFGCCINFVKQGLKSKKNRKVYYTDEIDYDKKYNDYKIIYTGKFYELINLSNDTHNYIFNEVIKQNKTVHNLINTIIDLKTFREKHEKSDVKFYEQVRLTSSNYEEMKFISDEKLLNIKFEVSVDVVKDGKIITNVISDKKKKELNKSSKKMYESVMDAMKKQIGDINLLTHEKITKYFIDNKITESMQFLYHCALLRYLDANYIELIKIIKDDIKKYVIKKNDEYNNNVMTEREKAKFIQWTTILKIHKIMEENLSKTENIDYMMDYVMISLYVKQVPRRVGDYVNMVISDDASLLNDKIKITTDNINIYDVLVDAEFSDEISDDKNDKKNDSKNDEKKNYYVNDNDGGYFIFNVYKTCDTYGKQIIKVNDELNEILKKYISHKKLKNGDNFFNNMTGSNYISRFEDTFHKFYGKRPSISTIRKSYVSYTITNETSQNAKNEISKMMAHSKDMQASVYRKIDMINENNDIDIINNDVVDDWKKTRNKNSTIEEKKQMRALRNKRYNDKQKLKININNDDVKT